MKLVSVLRRLQFKKQQRESTEGKEVVEEIRITVKKCGSVLVCSTFNTGSGNKTLHGKDTSWREMAYCRCVLGGNRKCFFGLKSASLWIVRGQ